MWQTFIFGMHWRHGGKLYYDEVPAVSKEEAEEYFINHKRDDVVLVRVELIGPEDYRFRSRPIPVVCLSERGENRLALG
jgi:hypothetical protein